MAMSLIGTWWGDRKGNRGKEASGVKPFSTHNRKETRGQTSSGPKGPNKTDPYKSADRLRKEETKAGPGSQRESPLAALAIAARKSELIGAGNPWGNAKHSSEKSP